MKSLLIKNGQLLAPANGYRRDKKDIFVKNGKIEKIGDNLDVEAEKVIDAEGAIVTPGFIDTIRTLRRHFWVFDPECWAWSGAPPLFWTREAAEPTTMRTSVPITLIRQRPRYLPC